MKLPRALALIIAGTLLQACLETGSRQASSGSAAAQSVSATADPAALEYPVALATPAMQRELGIGESFANKCYYYGDGGTTLTVSNQFLAKYKARGFSLRTMCMGLVSQIRFHPETGKRLATIMFGEGPPQPPQLVTHMLIPLVISSEYPVQLPVCFRRGLPLSDCKFNYNPDTGKRMSSADTAKVERAGAKALQAGRAKLAAGKYARACRSRQEQYENQSEKCFVEVYGQEEVYIKGFLATEVYADSRELLPLGGFVDFSPVFAEGFGYAISADGSAGPSFEMADASLKIDGKGRASQATLDALKILVASD